MQCIVSKNKNADAIVFHVTNEHTSSTRPSLENCPDPNHHDLLNMQRIPLFAEEGRRRINLGGTSSAVSHSTIIDSARLKRLERLEQKRRHDSACKLQEWWRGVIETKQLKKELRARFEADVLGIDGMRCLVLLDNDEEALAIWSRAVLASESGKCAC